MVGLRTRAEREDRVSDAAMKGVGVSAVGSTPQIAAKHAVADASPNVCFHETLMKFSSAENGFRTLFSPLEMSRRELCNVMNVGICNRRKKKSGSDKDARGCQEARKRRW